MAIDFIGYSALDPVAANNVINGLKGADGYTVKCFSVFPAAAPNEVSLEIADEIGFPLKSDFLIHYLDSVDRDYTVHEGLQVFYEAFGKDKLRILDGNGDIVPSV